MECQSLLDDMKTDALPIPPDAAQAFDDVRNRLVADVDQALADHPDLARLIGGTGSISVMKDNHRNHAAFMSTVFHLNQKDLLCRTIPWVYRTYAGRGFGPDYFPVALSAWQAAVRNRLSPAKAAPILAIYDWIKAHHQDWIRLSQNDDGADPGSTPAPDPPGVQTWVDRLLSGDSRACIALAREQAPGPEHISGLYIDQIQPALHRIGRLWETGTISPAQEHMASAIVSRIMAMMYEQMPWPDNVIGKAVIACAPDEFHEIGARMVADLLEMDGWNVTFLGANTPTDDLLSFLTTQPPDFLGISVSMTYHLTAVREIITRIRQHPELSHLKIMVGGPGTGDLPSLWQATGADGWAANARDAVALARQLMDLPPQGQPS
jgi:MerR family transcriptional regulator, light-induced transcriptional regulator